VQKRRQKTTVGNANKHTVIKTAFKWQPAARKINTRASWLMLLFAAPPAMCLSRIASVLKGCKLMQRGLAGGFARSPEPAQAPNIGLQLPCIGADIGATNISTSHTAASTASSCIQVEESYYCFLSTRQPDVII